MSDAAVFPSKLDAPAKFFVWDADIGVVFGFGLFTGIIVLDSVPLGVILGFVGGLAWSKAKSGRHPAFHLHLIYWNTPWRLRCTPPSYLREMVG